jgi:hypothetical protein
VLTKRPTPFAGRFAADHWDKYAPGRREEPDRGEHASVSERGAQRGPIRQVTHHQRGLWDVPDPDVFRCPGDGDRPARQRRPDQPALGAGEPSTVTRAPAVANAVFDATGVRLRQMPFTPERVRADLLQSGGH